MVDALHVKTLVLSHNAISDSTLVCIVTALRAHGDLVTLDLSGNQLRTLSGIEQLMKDEGRTNKAPPITTLVLRDNRLSRQGGVSFVGSLKFNLRLTSLDLRNCNLGESASILLGPMLQVSDSQRTIRASNPVEQR
jgi:Leucine-rich repeat (LRR) protein